MGSQKQEQPTYKLYNKHQHFKYTELKSLVVVFLKKIISNRWIHPEDIAV